jgi:hypothetical protein
MRLFDGIYKTHYRILRNHISNGKANKKCLRFTRTVQKIRRVDWRYKTKCASSRSYMLGFLQSTLLPYAHTYSNDVSSIGNSWSAFCMMSSNCFVAIASISEIVSNLLHLKSFLVSGALTRTIEHTVRYQNRTNKINVLLWSSSRSFHLLLKVQIISEIPGRNGLLGQRPSGSEKNAATR